MDQGRINQAELSRQVVEGEARFKIMTETNPAGMFYLSPLGEVVYANDTCKRCRQAIWPSHSSKNIGFNMIGHVKNHSAPM